MPSRHNSPALTSGAPASLVTNSTILILGGVLIGMGAVDIAAPAVRGFVYLAGSFGIVAWVGLAYVARRGRQQAQEREARLAASRMAGRVGRHLASASRAGRRTRIHQIETPASQHVPVVSNTRGPKHGVRDRAGSVR